MTSITKNSGGVLPWSDDSIENAPAEKGLYVLRSLPTQNGIAFIGYTDNLKKELKDKWENREIPEVAWFDWYTVATKDYGEDLLKKWVEKYSPKLNLIG